MDDHAPRGRLTFNREPKPLPKSALQQGSYYVGVCRNASVARWDGMKFWYWRVKFGTRFIEAIHHRDDDEVFDVFDAWREARPDEVAPIDYGEVHQGRQGQFTDADLTREGQDWG